MDVWFHNIKTEMRSNRWRSHFLATLACTATVDLSFKLDPSDRVNQGATLRIWLVIGHGRSLA